MKPGFIETLLDTRSANGRDDVLLSPLHFVDEDGTLYEVPVGADTDGGSTPRFAWLVPGFEPTGQHWFDWILHDSGYRGTLRSFREGRWGAASLTRLQCDQLLDRALRIHGMGPVQRFLVFRSIRAEGWKYYQANP